MGFSKKPSGIRYVNGYRLVYKPDHPSSTRIDSETWGGWIYEHILIAEESMGRKLRDGEVVHHLDFNRLNNRTENLLVLENSQHMKFHMWLQAGAPISKDIGENGVNSGKPKEVRFCKVCGKTLQKKQMKYCSKVCSAPDIQTSKPKRIIKEYPARRF